MSARWSDEDLFEAADLLRTDMTPAQVAAKMGRSEAALRGAFQRASLRSPAEIYREHHPAPAAEPKRAVKVDRAAERALEEELEELRERVAFVDRVGTYPEPPRVPAREPESARELTAVVLASDWHVEETVEPEGVMGRNRYDLDVASGRVDRFFGAVRWNVEHQRASGRLHLRDMVLWLGGDLMSGYIHEELEESNSLSPTETILWLLPRLEGGIRHLLGELDLVSLVVPCSFGNHGRTGKKPRVSTAYKNSYEWLMYHTLAERFKGEPRVQFHVTAAAHQYVHLYDRWVLHFHHGDSLNYAGGVGGLGIPLLKAVAAWDTVKRADYHCVGHWHQLRDYGAAIVNGSLVGYSSYSMKIRAPFEPPAQAMFYIDKVRGKTMMTPLWVADRADDGGVK